MTECETGNLFTAVASGDVATQENFTEILTRPGLKIERIVSHQHASPPGFWYDQPQHEWVVVLEGSAHLRFEEETGARLLGRGDYVFIAANRRHRVEATSDTGPTIWLAVHFAA